LTSDPYATHLPVLKAIPRLWPIQRVAEFGSGLYSTPTFLDREVYPDLKFLWSNESDLEWARQHQPKEKYDPRYSPTYFSEELAIAEMIRMGQADLVLVDGATEKMRPVTAIAASVIAPLIVLHDAENESYRRAIDFFPRRYIYQRETPWTAVLSDTIDLEPLRLMLEA